MYATTDREKRIQKILNKGLALFKADYREKGISKSHLEGAVFEATHAGTEKLMAGMARELNEALKIDGDEKKRAEIADIFRVGLLAVNRLLDMGKMKSGRGHWFAYSSNELPQPRKELQGPEGWVSVMGAHVAPPESQARIAPGKSQELDVSDEDVEEAIRQIRKRGEVKGNLKTKMQRKVIP